MSVFRDQNQSKYSLNPWCFWIRPARKGTDPSLLADSLLLAGLLAEPMVPFLLSFFLVGAQEKGQTRLRLGTRYCLLVSKKSPKSLFCLVFCALVGVYRIFTNQKLLPMSSLLFGACDFLGVMYGPVTISL